MFHALFVEIGPWSSSLALLLVVAVPAMIAAGATVRAARRG
jgi:hypothetical protein